MLESRDDAVAGGVRGHAVSSGQAYLYANEMLILNSLPCTPGTSAPFTPFYPTFPSNLFHLTLLELLLVG